MPVTTSGGQSGARQVAPAGGGNGQLLGDFELSSAAGQQVAPSVQLAPSSGQRDKILAQQQQQQQQQWEFRVIASNSHIQILENGSMLIKDVDLADASRYSCQASNGINPSLSEVIELTVLSKCPNLCLRLFCANFCPILSQNWAQNWLDSRPEVLALVRRPNDFLLSNFQRTAPAPNRNT